MIEALCEARRAGVADFEVAWAMALEANPASARDLAGRARGGALFDMDDRGGQVADGEPLADFLHRVCGDAWAGRNPALGKLVGTLEHFDADDDPITFGSGHGVQRGSVHA